MRTVAFDFSDPDNPVAILDKTSMGAADPSAIKQITVPFLLGKNSAAPMTDWAQIKALDPKKLPKGYSYLPDTDKFKAEILGDENRSMLGTEQEDWLSATLQSPSAQSKPWQIFGQQLLAGKVGIPLVADDEIDYEHSHYFTQGQMAFFRMLGQLGLPMNLDAWDGYPTARNRIFATIKDNAANAVFLAGDTHNAWAFDLADDDGQPVGVEFATSSISSPGLENYLPVNPETLRTALMNSSPELKFANTKDRGWITLSVSMEQIVAQWHFVSSVISAEYTVMDGDRLATKRGDRTISTPS